MERPIYLTKEEAAHIMVLLSETPTLLERAEKLDYPVTEKELLNIVAKARQVSWDFIKSEQKQKVNANCDCSKHERKQAGDCPAGRWWWVCGNCGKKV